MSDSRELFTTLRQKITAHQATVGIIGLGYVGLPLVGVFIDKGFSVVGFDIDAKKVESLHNGVSYIAHIPSARIAGFLESGRFAATTDFSRLGDSDAILICVPTPLGQGRSPDLSYVEATARSIAPHLRRGQLIVLESSTYPGTTVEILKPILETSGLVSGEDFFLAYSPEREDPGNSQYGTAKIPKVVGGEGDEALNLACLLYDQVVAGTVPVSSSSAAEAVKLTENIFRAVNIALMNELKIVYGAMGIDIWEVIEAAKTKPFGFMPFYPGPGLGGHCIPIDPFYLTWKARQHGVETRFIELAGEVNTTMPRLVVDGLAKALKAATGTPLAGARVLLLGAAYKKNVDDIRESPFFVLLELLEAAGARVDYYDPHVPVLPATRDHGPLSGRRSIEWEAASLAAYDAALICTDHDDVDYATLVQAAPLVADTRGVLFRRGLLAPNVVSL